MHSFEVNLCTFWEHSSLCFFHIRITVFLAALNGSIAAFKHSHLIPLHLWPVDRKWHLEESLFLLCHELGPLAEWGGDNLLLLILLFFSDGFPETELAIGFKGCLFLDSNLRDKDFPCISIKVSSLHFSFSDWFDALWLTIFGVNYHPGYSSKMLLDISHIEIFGLKCLIYVLVWLGHINNRFVLRLTTVD